MLNLKILQLLSTFSADEFNEFVNFADSTYYRKGRKYNDILDEIKKYLMSTKITGGINSEKFYDKLIKDKKLNSQTLRNRINELSKLGEKFIMEKELSKDKNLCKLLLLRGYKERKLTKQFNSEYNKFTVSTEKNTQKMNVISDIMDLKVMLLKENRDFENMFSEFNKYLEYLIVYFLETIFDLSKEHEIEKRYGVTPPIKILENLTANINSEGLLSYFEEQNNPFFRLLIINFYKYKSLVDLNDLSWPAKLEKMLFGRMNELSDTEKNDIMTHMITYYFYKINAGETDYLKDVFKLYKLKLKLGLVEELKEIRYPSSAFRDYVVVGIRLKQYKWVESFISEYSRELPDEIRDEETNSAFSRLYFGKKEYEKSLEMCKNIQSVNPLYFLDASRTKLRIYYETLNFEEAFLEMDRIKHYLKNNSKRIALSVRKYSKEFIDFYNELLKFRLNPNKKELGYFNKKVDESGTLITKNWFIEKVKEM